MMSKYSVLFLVVRFLDIRHVALIRFKNVVGQPVLEKVEKFICVEFIRYALIKRRAQLNAFFDPPMMVFVFIGVRVIGVTEKFLLPGKVFFHVLDEHRVGVADFFRRQARMGIPMQRIDEVA